SFTIELINAIKYLTKICYLTMGFLLRLEVIEWWAMVIIGIIFYFFFVLFDSRVDFNLLHINSSNFLLRDKLKFEKWVYYYVLVTNAVIRVTWLEYPLRILLPFHHELVAYVISVLEIYRRIQWNIIRVENEHLHNV